jgi:hypothetical protein
MLWPLATTRSALAAEQLSHRLVVGDSARPAGSDPLAVRCERGIDLGFFEKRSRGAAGDRLEPSQLGQRDDRSRFAAEVDHLIGLVFSSITDSWWHPPACGRAPAHLSAWRRPDVGGGGGNRLEAEPL